LSPTGLTDVKKYSNYIMLFKFSIYNKDSKIVSNQNIVKNSHFSGLKVLSYGFYNNYFMNTSDSYENELNLFIDYGVDGFIIDDTTFLENIVNSKINLIYQLIGVTFFASFFFCIIFAISVIAFINYCHTMRKKKIRKNNINSDDIELNENIL
jgi:hypothetical protein